MFGYMPVAAEGVKDAESPFEADGKTVGAVKGVTVWGPWLQFAAITAGLMAGAVAISSIGGPFLKGSPTTGQWDPQPYDGRRLDALQMKAEKNRSHPDTVCYTVSAKDYGRPWGDCYKHVLWAKYHGIKNHPDWYVEADQLHDAAPLESFQYYLYAHNLHGWVCPQPCPTGTRTIYYRKYSGGSRPPTGMVHPTLELKYGECTYDGDEGANMLVGNFSPTVPQHDANYYAHVHHFDNVFCAGNATKVWRVFTDGSTNYGCCAANGTLCEAWCSAS